MITLFSTLLGFFGAAMPDRRWAGAAGVAALGLSLDGYYLMIELRYGYGGSRGSLLLWGTGALIGGTVFGIAGQWWRRGRPWQVAASIGVLAAVFVAEGAYQVRIQPDAAIGVGFVLVGLVIPLVFGRSWGERGRAYLAMVPALALGALGFVALIAFANLTAGVGGFVDITARAKRIPRDIIPRPRASLSLASTMACRWLPWIE